MLLPQSGHILVFCKYARPVEQPYHCFPQVILTTTMLAS